VDPSFLVIQALNGLSSASSLFITACGLTLVFGVTRIVNFAHGSLYMIGAYTAATLVPRLLEYSFGPITFWVGIFAAALFVGIIGILIEVLLLRRIYGAPELFQLLATFGVVLVVQDLVILAFGPEDILGPRAPGLRAPVEILGRRFPSYELVLIAAGPVVLGLVWLLLRKTRFGVLVRAATQDRDMIAALGVNQRLLFTGTLFLGAFLAGLGGALQIPRVSAHAGMDLSIIAEAFVVTVVGGMGSVPGAFLAALIIGQLQAFGILLFPKSTLVVVFLLMAVVLAVRPNGFFGRPEVIGGTHAVGIASRKHSPLTKLFAFFALLILAALPLIGDAYVLKVGTEILIFALFAFSLQLLIGVGGIVSFGHAAFFGLGAYGAALAVKWANLPMEGALPMGLLLAAIGAAAIGAFVVRLSGIYLAMMTLATAQIIFAVAFQWVDVTGGDNGIVGVWPSAWASGQTMYYLFTLALTALTVLLLTRIIDAPFGYALRAARDSEQRSESIGLKIRQHRWIAFAISGAAAGLAGGLYAFSRGSVDPTLLGIPTSVDALTMLLLGGIQTITGPLWGAGVLHVLRDQIMPLTSLWRLVLGASIIAIVLIFPRGLVGTIQHWREERA
jgi:branched-chain amino acid transport system permease protein